MAERCKGTRKDGQPCKRWADKGSEYCSRHAGGVETYQHIRLGMVIGPNAQIDLDILGHKHEPSEQLPDLLDITWQGLSVELSEIGGSKIGAADGAFATIPVVYHPISKTEIACLLGNKYLVKFDLTTGEWNDDATPEERVERIRIRNKRLGIAPLRFSQPSQPEPPPKETFIASPARTRKTRTPIAKNGYFVTPSDRIHKATVEALAPGAMQQGIPLETQQSYGLLPGQTFWAAYPFETEDAALRGMVGFPRKPEDAIWQLLQKNGALAVKAHFALWGRAYAETDAAPGVFIEMSIPEFCDDLGYVRLRNGSHRPDHKRKAMQVLELHTSIHLCGIYKPPKGAPKLCRGPIWLRGVSTETGDAYSDLFGAAREGDPEMWEPLSFRYASGDWFSDETWRRYNRDIALVGEGLLRDLRVNTDQWAIMLGGFLATQIRMNGWRPLVRRAQILLLKTGLAYSDRHNPGRQLRKLEEALDRLVEIGFIEGWEYTNTDPAEPDMDDPEQLARLSLDANNPKRRNVLIRWPSDIKRREKELEARRKAQYEKALKAKN